MSVTLVENSLWAVGTKIDAATPKAPVVGSSLCNYCIEVTPDKQMCGNTNGE